MPNRLIWQHTSTFPTMSNMFEEFYQSPLFAKEQKTVYRVTQITTSGAKPVKLFDMVRKITWRHTLDTVDIAQTVGSRTSHVLIFIFWSDTWVITKRQHRHSSSLSEFCCSITPFSGESKPWHLYALANTVWNKQSCEAEPGTNFISSCHLWLITGCSQWLASRSKVLGG